LRLHAVELGAERIPEERVVSVPLSRAIEGLDEEVAVLERGDLPGRVAAAQDVVAERSREPTEDGGAPQEVETLRRQAPEDRAREVVHEVSVGATLGSGSAGAIPTFAERHHLERDGRRPPTRTLDHGVELGRLERHAGRTHELLRLAGAEGE